MDGEGVLEKPKRVVDFDLLYRTKQDGCSVCGRRPADPAHIKSRGAGGPDLKENVIPLCRQHHSEQHQRGWIRFIQKYFHIRLKLEALGWEIGPDKIRHPDF